MRLILLAPLSPVEQAYQAVVLASTVTFESHATLSMHLDVYSQSPWLVSWDSLDPLNEKFPTDESITEVMSLEETPWNDAHHCSSFLPSLGEISSCLDTFVSRTITHPLQTPILVHEFLSEGNMGNITAALPIDISVPSEIVKIFQLGLSFSHDEIKIFLPSFMRSSHRVSIVHPFLKWSIHPMTRNPHSHGRHGGIVIYVCYSTIWLSQCLHIMLMVKV